MASRWRSRVSLITCFHSSECGLRPNSARSGHVGFGLTENISRWRRLRRIRAVASQHMKKVKRAALKDFVGSFRAACWGLVELDLKTEKSPVPPRIVKNCEALY